MVMTLHPLAAEPKTGWRLITSSFRVLANDPLMESKTCSKVRSVLARDEAEDQGADEALLLNERGEITEGAATNFFCIQGSGDSHDVVCTPPLAAGLLPGVTRAAVLEVCGELGIKTAQRAITPADVVHCTGAFLTVSTIGVVEATTLDGKSLRRSSLVAQIAAQYRQLVQRETSNECGWSSHGGPGAGEVRRPNSETEINRNSRKKRKKAQRGPFLRLFAFFAANSICASWAK